MGDNFFAMDGLSTESTTCSGVLNRGQEDEMKVTGYRRSLSRAILCWVCICLTGGLLRLVMHWWKHLYLLATHCICPLEVADTVLIEEHYKGQHKCYHIKSVQYLDYATLKEMQMKRMSSSSSEKKVAITSDSTTNSSPSASTKLDQHSLNKLDSILEMNEYNFHLSLHFESGFFRYCKSARIFVCKQLRYAWNNQTHCFEQLQGLDVNIMNSFYYKQMALSADEQLARRLVYGNNEITVPYKDLKTLLFLEVLNPFYVFQMFSVLLWFTYSYYYYACVIILMTMTGIIMSTRQTKKNQDVLQKTVQTLGTALLLNDRGEVNEVSTLCLVPGDIIEIPSRGCVLYCDAILLSGNCILDESMLTGESVPVTKTPLPPKLGVTFDKKEHARHTLFCGTKVIQTRHAGSDKVLAVVINTGNKTAKGGLIRSILYPPLVDYKFEKDSYKFVAFLGVIALIGFFYTIFTKISRGVDAMTIIVESLDLITIVVPPALPAAMTVGRFYAQKRLKQDNIYCISPRSINVAGGIDCCCFDKTGTLTEDGLDMWGVVPKSATNQFQIPIKQIERLPNDKFLFGMVTCHSITNLNGKLMGDPLDLKMFESTGWVLEDPHASSDSQKYGLSYPTIVRQPKRSSTSNHNHTATSASVLASMRKRKDESVQSLNLLQESIGGARQDGGGDCIENVGRQCSLDDLLLDVGILNGEASNNDHGIVREFPFSSNLQRMSVITRRLCEKNFNVYCKGSPEMLQQLCTEKSIPNDYSEQLASFAKQGYRVIAMAYKPLSAKVNYTQMQRLTRESVECGLEFLGFVVLENRLKADTTEVINHLTAANIRSIMVTGDNLLTALSVARDCGIVRTSQAVVTVHVRHQPQTNGSGPTAICPPTTHSLNSSSSSVNHNNYELYYTLDLGSKNCTSSETRVTLQNHNGGGGGGGGGGRSGDFMANGNTLLEDQLSVNKDTLHFDNYQRLNGDITSLSSNVSITMLPPSVGSIETVSTWTHNDDEQFHSGVGRGVALVEAPPPAPPPPQQKSRNIFQRALKKSNVMANGGGGGSGNPATTAASWRNDYRFAMVGSTWQIVRDHFPDLLKHFLTRGVIYARMSPEQKQALIVELQALDYCVAMCGDGANDCGALKVAHAGISLSEMESSIASPFTSRKATIGAVPNVIREGRTALVTSFGIFKYMAAYSIVQFISVMMLYSVDLNLTDRQFLYIDLFLISVFAFFFGHTKSFRGPLDKQVPLSSLLSFTPLASIFLNLMLVAGFQVLGWFYLRQQPWFTPYADSSNVDNSQKDNDNFASFENYTLFSISSLQYIILAFIYSKGAPYRRPIWSNWPFCLTIILNLLFVIYLIVSPFPWLRDFMELMIPDDMGFRLWLIAGGLITFFLHLLIEDFIVEYLIFRCYQAKRDYEPKTTKHRYRQIEHDLQQYFRNWPEITNELQAHLVGREEKSSHMAPAYVEISAEQNLETPDVSGDNPLSGFFEIDTNHPSATTTTTTTTTPTAATNI